MQKDGLFGIALIQDGSEVGSKGPLPHIMGCIAEIKKADHKANGDIHITVEGRQRFRLVEELRRSPTWLAKVELLEEPLGDKGSATALRQELRASMSRYANLYYLLTAKQLFFEKHFRDRVRLSYFLADLMDIEMNEKQTLLEAPDAAHRLEQEKLLVAEQNERLEVFWSEHKFSKN